jgi:hypothetical protein
MGSVQILPIDKRSIRTGGADTQIAHCCIQRFWCVRVFFWVLGSSRATPQKNPEDLPQTAAMSVAVTAVRQTEMSVVEYMGMRVVLGSIGLDPDFDLALKFKGLSLSRSFRMKTVLLLLISRRILISSIYNKMIYAQNGHQIGHRHSWRSAILPFFHACCNQRAH